MSSHQASPVVEAHASLRQVMAVIGQHRAGCVVMVDGHGRATGLIDDRCVLDGLLRGYELDAPATLLQRPLDATVGVDARRADVLDVMEARGLPLVPIVDGDGRLVGVHLRDELIGPATLDNWAVIMAGGRGTRLAPLTDTIPKPMLPVAGRPILERLVLHLVGAGIRTIFLAVNYRREQIEEHFGNGSDFGCSIKYLVEDPDQPLGSGGALSLLNERRWFPKRPVLVLNGDLVVDFSIPKLLAAHARSNDGGSPLPFSGALRRGAGQRSAPDVSGGKARDQLAGQHRHLRARTGSDQPDPGRGAVSHHQAVRGVPRAR
jgi:CTP:molybdopterin cytidylyltransferase MocA